MDKLKELIGSMILNLQGQSDGVLAFVAAVTTFINGPILPSSVAGSKQRRTI